MNYWASHGSSRWFWGHAKLSICFPWGQTFPAVLFLDLGYFYYLLYVAMEMGRSQMLRVGIWGHRRHLSLYIVWSGLLFPAAVESRVYLMKRELMGLEPNEYRETLLHLHAPGQWGISWRGRWARENRLAAVCQGGSFIPRPIENRTIHQNKRPIHYCLQSPHLPCSEWNFPKLFPSCSARKQNKWEGANQDSTIIVSGHLNNTGKRVSLNRNECHGSCRQRLHAKNTTKHAL